MPEIQIVHDALAHYLSKPGISKDVAVGIVSVVYAGESKLKTGSQGAQSTETPGALNPGGAYGIASWNGPRQAALKAFADKHGRDVSALETQLDFVLTESANSYPKVWEAIKRPGITYAEFIPIFVADYENPADHAKEIAEAMAVAPEFMAYQITPTIASPAAAPAPIPAVAPAAPGATPASEPAIAAIEAEIATIDPAKLAAFASIIEAFFTGAFRAVIKA